MTKKCMMCGMREMPHQKNYSGFHVIKEGDHAFPQRVQAPVIKGDKACTFLCGKCATKFYPIKCKVHGKINGKYDWGKPPSCAKCAEELETIKKGGLPPNFDFRIPLKEFSIRGKGLFKGGNLLMSNDGDIHLVTEKLVYSESAQNFIFDVKSVPYRLTFEMYPRKDSIIRSALFGANDICDFDKASGPWLNLWLPKLNETLNSDSSSTRPVLCTFAYWQPRTKEFDDRNTDKDLCFVSRGSDTLSLYPHHQMPALDQLTRWEQTTISGKRSLSLWFLVDKIPHRVVFEEINGIEYPYSLKNLSEALPENQKDQTLPVADTTAICRAEVTLYPEEKECQSLLKLVPDAVELEILEESADIHFTHGFTSNDCFLLVNRELRYASGKLYHEAVCRLEQNVKPIHDFENPEGNSVFFLLEEKMDAEARAITLLEDKLVINNNISIKYAELGQIEVNTLGRGIARVTFSDKTEKKDTWLALIAPQTYAYKLLEAVEVRKAADAARKLCTAELYRQYHEHKKNNLLIGLFSGIILLDKELNDDITLNDLEEKIAKIKEEDFVKNQKLYGQVCKKLFLVTKLLPGIKQGFEYLSAFAPYYLFQNEIHLVDRSFGQEISRKIGTRERRQTVRAVKQVVQLVQSNFQRVFLEMERSIATINHIIVREELEKNFFSEMSKWFPHVGQGSLIGVMALTGSVSGPVGLLAGMLAIRSCHDWWNRVKINKEHAVQVKRSFESVMSWWAVLKRTFPVVLYEAADNIDCENERCYLRDKRIFSKLSNDQKWKAANQLKSELRDQIFAGTKNRFLEVLAGSGVRFHTLASEIDNALGVELNRQIKQGVETLMLPPAKEFDNGRQQFS